MKAALVLVFTGLFLTVMVATGFAAYGLYLIFWCVTRVL
jgi:hypothetical protein